ncbi:MAG: hypothetical protein IIC22_04050 [Chloroflexi bacterium]|nr:hypothetical protein [Chloroflexota bacterium]
MGLLSALFGRSKLRKPNREQFFAVITAGVSLEGRTDIRLTEKAGLVFNPVESLFFDTLETELHSLLEISKQSTGTRFEIIDDSFGTKWVVLDDPDFDDLVTTIHLMGETITEHGFGDRMLAAVFGLDYGGKKAYWIYNIKRGRFYPLVLDGPQQRDNAAEMRLGALMEEERLPMEKSLESWYALWGIPF